MPSSPDYQRDYKQEYAEYQSQPVQMKHRAMRNAARKKLAQIMGKPIKRGFDVDHITPLAQGGDNEIDNLRAIPASKNRSFHRNAKAQYL